MRAFVPSYKVGLADPPLSEEEIHAMRQACAPAGTFGFPPVEIMRTLRQHGYIEVVIGGVQVTPRGLERLVRERASGE